MIALLFACQPASVPPMPSFGAPCEDESTCDGGMVCIRRIDTGEAFCTQPCEFRADCPEVGKDYRDPASLETCRFPCEAATGVCNRNVTCIRQP